MDKKTILIIAGITILSGLFGGIFSLFFVTAPVVGRINTYQSKVENALSATPIPVPTPELTATPSAIPEPTVKVFKYVAPTVAVPRISPAQ